MTPLNLKDYRDLDALLKGRLINRVHQVGIELEGGWKKPPEGVTIEPDTSVQNLAPGAQAGLSPEETTRYQYLAAIGTSRPFSPEENREYRALYARQAAVVNNNYGNGKLHAGELPLTPLAPQDLRKNLETFWPDVVNATCGLHVHMSFRTPFTYMRLMEARYPSTIIEYMKRWGEHQGLPADHPLWPRLRGESRYCQHVFSAEGQSKRKDKGHNQTELNHRYTVIHYCWERYQTIECRLLPMFAKWQEGAEAIQRLIDITNAYLRATDGRPERISSELVVNPSGERIEKHDLIRLGGT